MQFAIKDPKIELLLWDYEKLLIAQCSLYGLESKFQDFHHLTGLIAKVREKLIGKIALLGNEKDFYENRFSFINNLYLGRVKRSKGIRAGTEWYSFWYILLCLLCVLIMRFNGRSINFVPTLTPFI